eukprot:7360292-Pyramimonas_sp.AAC.1
MTVSSPRSAAAALPRAAIALPAARRRHPLAAPELEGLHQDIDGVVNRALLHLVGALNRRRLEVQAPGASRHLHRALLKK